jgi:hypothetical protein
VEAKCPGMTVFVQDDCDGEILKALEIHWYVSRTQLSDWRHCVVA